MKCIGIFPGSGGLGGSTYDYLLKLLPSDHIILINRHPERVPQEHIKNGLRARKASYESSPSDLEAAFAGIEVLFLISYPSHVHEYRKKVRGKSWSYHYQDEWPDKIRRCNYQSSMQLVAQA